MPCGRFFTTYKQLFQHVQYRFYEMKPEISEHKHSHEKQQNRANLSQRHIRSHFVANWVRKKSVKAASSSSCDTYTYSVSSSSQS